MSVRSRMELRLTRSMWGIFDPSTKVAFEPSFWEETFQKLQAEGYRAIESWCNIQFNVFHGKEEEAKALLKKYDLDLICQGHTCGYPVSSRKVEDHVASFREQVECGKAMGATFINMHSGSDSWSFQQSLDFFRQALAIEEEVGVKVVHETHRQRIMYNPWITRDILLELPQFKVNADLSHFCVVAERVFDDGEMDVEWPSVLRLIGTRCHLIHARVGYAEGPQVCDPAAPEYTAELEAHERWWKVIWDAMAERGEPVLFMEPEHGPPPYLHTLAYTNVPVTDLWRVNSFIGKRVQANFAAWQQQA